ncbi:hypothetical protein F3Y22_tig00117048pilonHSYRG00361 [Hibiscus syriacus]|uniref:Uncharacterized protein n=1 Tax=Hibiscus syriacus TaxID=106335 RepID=A0A6A2WXQ5_HIBSY|nr:hypothetical protein F3Y22_tig00117048pilonHSYRG00361 [Hibiscus syriacus]
MDVACFLQRVVVQFIAQVRYSNAFYATSVRKLFELRTHTPMETWEDWISKVDKGNINQVPEIIGAAKVTHSHHLQLVLQKFAWGYWRKAAVISWIMSFFKQFCGSVTESEYIDFEKGLSCGRMVSSCLMERQGFVITRLIMGVIVQVYALHHLAIVRSCHNDGNTSNTVPVQGQPHALATI